MTRLLFFTWVPFLLGCNSGEKNLTSRQNDSLELLQNDKKAVDDYLSYFNKCKGSKNKTDLDGDGKDDEVSFEYTGGAHCCYKLSVKLSSVNKVHSFPFNMDGHYISGSPDDSYPWHFGIEDYDNDGLPEIFMQIDTYNSELYAVSFPEDSIFSNYVMIEYKNKKLVASDMKPYTDPWQYYYSQNILANKTGTLHPLKLKLPGSDTLWGYANAKGKMIILPQYRTALNFSDSRAFVKNCLSNWQIIDEQGRLISYAGEGWMMAHNTFSENLAIVQMQEFSKDHSEIKTGYKFIDTNGKVVSDFFYDLRAFSDGLIAAQQNSDGKWGYLDKNLNWAIPAKFENAFDFKNDSAYVDTGAKTGGLEWINKKGEILKRNH